MKKFLDIYMPILLGVILSIFTCIFLNGKYDFRVIISFIGVILGTCILLLISFSMKYAYFEIIMCIFYILFFIIAPIIQLDKGFYPIPFPIKIEHILRANTYNIIFIGMYTIFRYTSIKKYKLECQFINQFNMKKRTRYIISLLFLIFLIPNIPAMLNNIINRSGYIDIDSKIATLIINKFIMFIPLLFVFYYSVEYMKKKDKKILCILIIWFFILIFCKNPFTEKRNGLGPIYGAIIMFHIYKKINVRNFFLIAIIGFVIGFPLTASITHSKLGINELLQGGTNVFDINSIIEQFSQMHFDAFEMLNVTIDYVAYNGFSIGRQLLGAIFFFIPRSIWTSKPLNTGTLIGNYLISNYGFIFNNLSSPITAEAYINGGIIAIVIFAFFISLWSKLVYKMLAKKDYYTYVGWYMSIHLFFLLRGDLMNGISYLIGPILALTILPKIINLKIH